jgi:hypothetical protein
MTLATHPFTPLAFSRRSALSLMSAGAVVALTGCSKGAQASAKPWLWTPEQEAGLVKRIDIEGSLHNVHDPVSLVSTIQALGIKS